jgi:hypothetical protein
MSRIPGFPSTSKVCRPIQPAVIRDLAKARRHVASVEYLCREARLNPNPRVIQTVLRVLELQPAIVAELLGNGL